MALILALLVRSSRRSACGPRLASWVVLIPALLVLFLPMSELAVGLVNHLLTAVPAAQRVLAKLEMQGRASPPGCDDDRGHAEHAR